MWGKECIFQIGFEKGRKEGKQEGKYKNNVIAIRNMSHQKFEITTITLVLDITTESVKKIQAELLLEPKILAALAKKQSPARIAKSLKVSVWLVEVIRDLQKKSRRSNK